GLLSPADGATYAAGDLISFNWSAVFGATGYEFEFDGDLTNRGSSLAYAADTISNGQHSWRVRAYNNLGSGPWSDFRTVIVYMGDPGVADTVRVGCPILVDPVVEGDSFAVPINVWFDEYVYDINLAFEYENEIIALSSVNIDNSIIPLDQQDALFVGFNQQGQYFTISWMDPTLELPLNPITDLHARPLLSVYFRVLGPAYGETRDIDTLILGTETDFRLLVDTTNLGPIPFLVTPQYVDCGLEDIVFGEQATPYAPTFVMPPCGVILQAPFGEILEVNIQVVDSTLGDKVTLTASSVPPTAGFSPTLPTSGNPVTTIFAWTPTESDLGLHTITLTATDSIDGLLTQCGLAIEIVNPDPGLADTVRIGCPVLVDPVIVGDSFAVPIYAWWDDYVYGLMLTFQYDSDVIEATSVADGYISLPPLPNSGIDTAMNTATLHWFDMSGEAPITPLTGMQGVVLNTVYFRIKEVAYNQTIAFTPTGLGQGLFQLTVSADGIMAPKTSFTPSAVTCDGEEIVLGDAEVICGDVNGDRLVDSDDIDYLVDYIFYDGLAPMLDAADVDQCGSVNVADAAYLARYVYSLTGPSPCMGDLNCYSLEGLHDVVLGCPKTIRAGDVDSVAIPILINTDTVINGFSIGLNYDSDYLDVHSVSLAGSIVPGGRSNFYVDLDTVANQVLVGWISRAQQQTIGPLLDGLICDLWFTVPADAPGHVVNIDTVVVSPAGEFMFSIYDGGAVKPSFLDCGSLEITVLPALDKLTMTDYYPLDTLMVDDTVKVRFSQAVNRTTVTALSFAVLDLGENAINGNRLFGDGDSTVIFVPTDVFPPLTEVHLSISGIEGIAGEVWSDDMQMEPSWPTSFGVYPGDLDNDGVVSAFDINRIAQFWQDTGLARVDFANRWRIPKLQGAHGWSQEAATYADGNGDGVINEADLFPIGRHFGDNNPYGFPIVLLSEHELVANYRSQLEALAKAIAGNQEPFMVQVQDYLARLLGQEILPDKFSISQNYPNPFNPETSIRLQLPQAGMVEVEVFNAQGQRVRTLLAQVMSPGEHSIKWDGRDEAGAEVASGVYFYRVTTDQLVETKKMLLLR
ncbi:MAG: dockerin type I domain-containing protein, partial [bacterium]